MQRHVERLDTALWEDDDADIAEDIDGLIEAETLGRPRHPVFVDRSARTENDEDPSKIEATNRSDQ